MRRARYEFETDKRYFAWVVAAKLLDLPSIGRSIPVAKITLATPYWIDGDELKPSGRMEAVLWVDPQKEDDAEFLRQAGVTEADGDLLPPQTDIPRLDCWFGTPQGRTRHQPLEEWEPIPPGLYHVESVVVPTVPPHGLVFGPNSVSKNGVKVRLTKTDIQILRALTRQFGHHVSLDLLRKAVESWGYDAEDSTIAQAINSLKKKLKPLGLTIGQRHRNAGWPLIKDE